MGVSALCCVFVSFERDHASDDKHLLSGPQQHSHTRLTHVWAPDRLPRAVRQETLNTPIRAVVKPPLMLDMLKTLMQNVQQETRDTHMCEAGCVPSSPTRTLIAGRVRPYLAQPEQK